MTKPKIYKYEYCIQYGLRIMSCYNITKEMECQIFRFSEHLIQNRQGIFDHKSIVNMNGTYFVFLQYT